MSGPPPAHLTLGTQRHDVVPAGRLLRVVKCTCGGRSSGARVAGRPHQGRGGNNGHFPVLTKINLLLVDPHMPCSSRSGEVGKLGFGDLKSAPQRRRGGARSYGGAWQQPLVPQGCCHKAVAASLTLIPLRPSAHVSRREGRLRSCQSAVVRCSMKRQCMAGWRRATAAAGVGLGRPPTVGCAAGQLAKLTCAE